MVILHGGVWSGGWLARPIGTLHLLLWKAGRPDNTIIFTLPMSCVRCVFGIVCVLGCLSTLLWMHLLVLHARALMSAASVSIPLACCAALVITLSSIEDAQTGVCKHLARNGSPVLSMSFQLPCFVRTRTTTCTPCLQSTLQHLCALCRALFVYRCALETLNPCAALLIICPICLLGTDS